VKPALPQDPRQWPTGDLGIGFDELFGAGNRRREVRNGFTFVGRQMACLYKSWDQPRSLFGDLIVVGFVLMQCLDGVLTYLGIGIWGPAIEANPLISSAMATAGVVAGLGGAKLVAIGLGMLLHLRRVHNLVALLTAIYFAAAVLPWTALFLR
jgi:hypothetical protein